jgi:hypothetical protein
MEERIFGKKMVTSKDREIGVRKMVFNKTKDIWSKTKLYFTNTQAEM